MNKWLRKLRGVVGLGPMWGVLWAVIFAGISIVVWFVDPEDIAPGEGPVQVGVIGLVSSVAFGILLTIAESSRAMHDIALGRAARWGSLASAWFPLVAGRPGRVDVLCPIVAALATAAVAPARKAERCDPRRPKRVLDALVGIVFVSVRDVVQPTKGPSARWKAA